LAFSGLTAAAGRACGTRAPGRANPRGRKPAGSSAGFRPAGVKTAQTLDRPRGRNAEFLAERNSLAGSRAPFGAGRNPIRFRPQLPLPAASSTLGVPGKPDPPARLGRTRRKRGGSEASAAWVGDCWDRETGAFRASARMGQCVACYSSKQIPARCVLVRLPGRSSTFPTVDLVEQAAKFRFRYGRHPRKAGPISAP